MCTSQGIPIVLCTVTIDNCPTQYQFAPLLAKTSFTIQPSLCGQSTDAQWTLVATGVDGKHAIGLLEGRSINSAVSDQNCNFVLTACSPTTDSSQQLTLHGLQTASS